MRCQSLCEEEGLENVPTTCRSRERESKADGGSVSPLLSDAKSLRGKVGTCPAGTTIGLTVMVAAMGFLAYPTLALLPGMAFATCSFTPAWSGRAGDGWCWGTFVSYQILEASLWSLAALFAYEITGLQRANPE